MFLSFKNMRPQKQFTENKKQDQLATRIVYKLIKAQERCAAFMQLQASRLSFKGKVLLFLIFVLSSTGYSIYRLAETFMGNKLKAYSIAPLETFKHIGKSSSETIPKRFPVTPQDHQKLQRFYYFIDSLQKTAAWKKMKGSIHLSHSGLKDSIGAIEEFYHLK